MTCHACGAQLSSTARFCHKCGAAVATAGVTGWRAGLPWGLAGAALGAYAQLPTLDADARYHVGMLQLAGGDANGALAQADTIRQSIPTHLFIYVLRAHAYQVVGNLAEERRAYADFLRNESAELARKRPEYAQGAHLDALTNFHSEAERQGRSGPGRNP